MPEGDTILRAARALDRRLAGKTVVSFESPIGRLERADLAGHRVTRVEARGKNLLVRFDDGSTLFSHMRMTGSWHLYRPGERWQKPAHLARAVLSTDDTVAVCFSAPVVEFLAARHVGRHERLSRLGPDVLGAQFDAADAVRRLRSFADRPIGEALLDQSALAGIGNIWKSETLFLCGADPFAPVSEFTPEELGRIVAKARALMSASVEGSPAGALRSPARGLRQVYRRSGEPCRRCGTTIRMRRQGTARRSTYWCPTCQPRRGSSRQLGPRAQPRRVRPVILLLAGVSAGLLAAAGARREVRIPVDDEGVKTLASRKAEQEKKAGGLGAFHDFRFHDRVAESGITFVQHPTDDSGKFYKSNHYDHGNGLAAADVDGDGLVDLYFVDQLSGNELWKNLGHGRFENVTARAGVALPGRIGVSASFADVDNDSDPDLFVTTVRGGNVLFLNDGKGRFRDVTAEAGLSYSGHSSGAVFFDYDNDGRLDLFLVNVGRYTTDEKGRGGYFVGFPDAFSGHLKPERTERSRLYRNVGSGRFADVTDQVGPFDTGWSGDASFADLDGDRFPELYVLNMQGDDHFFVNQQGKRFVDDTARYFPKTPWGTMGIKFFDFDNDGRVDLLLTDMHSDMSAEIGPDKEKEKSRMEWTDAFLQGGANNVFGNAFYRNLGGGRFEEISEQVGVENYWPWGPSVGDVNADGWDDVFIASGMGFPFRYGINSLLVNVGGQKFSDAEFLLGIEPRRGGATAAPAFDLDCATEGEGRKACVGQSGLITVLGTLSSRSSVMLDLDGDGDLDIVTNEFNAAPQILVSDLAEKKRIHFLQVRLAGSVSNRDGLGATVTVRAGSLVATKWNDGKSGYLSQSAMPLYFGLGDASKIDLVEVSWPSGRKSVIEHIPANGTLRVVEPR
jgi:DNA-formamidopyrimidine glycosylase